MNGLRLAKSNVPPHFIASGGVYRSKSMGTTSIHTHGCRISDEWTLRGMRTAVLENELIRVTVLLDRGAEIVELRHKPTDIDPLLRLPVPIHDPARVTGSIGGTVGNFMDMYLGGWQEIAPSGGPTNTHQGVEYGQHGEVSLLPWDAMVIEDTPERVTLRCQVRGVRTPIRIVRDMTVVRGVAAVQLNETFTNEAHHDIDVMWGHHIAYGLPFLTHGAKIHTSAQHIQAHNAAVDGPNRLSRSGATGQWPMIAGRDGAPFDASVIPAHAQAHGSDVFYLSDYNARNAWYCLYSDHHDVGVAVSWDAQVFTHVWLWEEFSRTEGFPWWGRSHALALEPWAGFPTDGLSEVVKQGNQLVIPAGKTITTYLTAGLYQGAATPRGVSRVGVVDLG
jgi:galactose mutarotase-like enzyme